MMPEVKISFDMDGAEMMDFWWRIENLYYVKNEAGEKVLFKLRPAQRQFLEKLWYLNVILKARQLGFTTIICIYFLDRILFQRDKSAGIIAHTKEDAENIFKNKIVFAWDNLPQWLKNRYVVDTSSAKQLQFNNGSSIRVATSMRSDTLQYLLITELGTLSLKYPEKAEEVISGSLNAIHQGQVLIIESTAKGQEGKFFEICQSALNIWRAGSEITKMDYRFFFFPWFLNPEYEMKSQVVITKEMDDYFNSIELKAENSDGSRGVSIPASKRKWYVKKLASMGESMKSEFPSTPEEAFEASVEGTIYAKELEGTLRARRICYMPHEPLLEVDTYWDLGVDDNMSIWFVQKFGKEIRFIDYYENSGEGLPHYATMLQSKRDELHYKYGQHYAPHDIAVREMTTGKTRLEIASEPGIGINFQVGKKIGIQEGIESVKRLFSRFFFDESRCAIGLKHLGNYRKDWDDKLGQWKPEPRHDSHSHCADALRTLGVSWADVYIPDPDMDRPIEDAPENKHGLFSEV